MEVLTTALQPFHDPDAKWVCRFDDTNMVLIVGSEQDRIRLTFTPDEARKLMSIWGEHILKDREWITPQEEP